MRPSEPRACQTLAENPGDRNGKTAIALDVVANMSNGYKILRFAIVWKSKLLCNRPGHRVTLMLFTASLSISSMDLRFFSKRRYFLISSGFHELASA